jgi:hypothetical protein
MRKLFIFVILLIPFYILAQEEKTFTPESTVISEDTTRLNQILKPKTPQNDWLTPDLLMNKSANQNLPIPNFVWSFSGGLHLVNAWMPLIGVSLKLWIHNKIGFESGGYTIGLATEFTNRILWKPINDEGGFVGIGVSEWASSDMLEGGTDYFLTPTLSCGIIELWKKCNVQSEIIIPLGGYNYIDNYGWKWEGRQTGISKAIIIGISISGRL